MVDNEQAVLTDGKFLSINLKISKKDEIIFGYLPLWPRIVSAAMISRRDNGCYLPFMAERSV
ncbi:MAG: hypothetical protein MK110_02755 [Fuerstiella sp.]|nr:hypothetical protein [Fuerstiella sp.]